MLQKQFQQGDCLLIVAQALPLGIKVVPAKGGRLVLAEGEHTGHAHTLEATPAVALYEDSHGTLWLRVESEAVLTHQEHHAQTVSPGVYRVGRVQEVDPFTDEVRAVQD